MKVIDFIVYNFSELEFYSPNYTYILCTELKAVLELNNIAVITVDSIISPTDISQQLSDLEHQLAQQSCWAICDMNELSDCRWELWLWIQGALLL